MEHCPLLNNILCKYTLKRKKSAINVNITLTLQDIVQNEEDVYILWTDLPIRGQFEGQIALADIHFIDSFQD